MKNIKLLVSAFLIFSISSCEEEVNTPVWEICNYVSDAALSTLFFVNENYGFVGGGDDGNVSSSLLIKTTDAGKTWKYIDFIAEKPIKKIFFLSEKVGFVSTKEHLYKSFNGGLDWIKIDLGEPFESDIIIDFAFADENHGYVICGQGEYGGYHKLISTLDGGLNWGVKLKSTSTYRLPELISVQTLKDNEDVVYISSEKSLYKSGDGGDTWQKIFSKETLSRFYFHFLDEKNGCIAEYGSLFITINDGENFEPFAKLSEEAVAKKPILINNTEGVIAIYMMYLFNAETKSIIPIEMPDKHGIADFVMFSATSGYAVTYESIYKFKGI